MVCENYAVPEKILGTTLLVAKEFEETPNSAKFEVEIAQETPAKKYRFKSNGLFVTAQEKGPVQLLPLSGKNNQVWFFNVKHSTNSDTYIENDSNSAFLSCRKETDQPDPITKGFKLREDINFQANFSSYVLKEEDYAGGGFQRLWPNKVGFSLNRYSKLEDIPNISTLLKNLSSLNLYQGDVHVKQFSRAADVLEVSGFTWQDKFVKDTTEKVTLRDPSNHYLPEEMLLLIAKCHRFAMDSHQLSNDSDRDTSLSFAKQAANEGKAALERISDDRLKTDANPDGKIPLNIGDYVKIVSTKTFKHLFGVAYKHPDFDKYFNNSAKDENQGILVCSTDYDDWYDKFALDEDESWWMIKGEHSEDQAFGATPLKTPVTSGMKIRLENLRSGKNLHWSTGQLSEVDPYWQDYRHTSVYGTEGQGDINDNWTITSKGNPGDPIYVGKEFKLAAAGNAQKLELASGPETNYYFPGKQKIMDNTIEYAFAQSVLDPQSEDYVEHNNYWAVESYHQGLWPTDAVFWTSNPTNGKEILQLETPEEKSMAKLTLEGTLQADGSLADKSKISLKTTKGSEFSKHFERSQESIFSQEEILRADFAKRLNAKTESVSDLKSWFSGLENSKVANMLTFGFAKTIGDYFSGKTSGDRLVFSPFDPSKEIFFKQPDTKVLRRNTYINNWWRQRLDSISREPYYANRDFKVSGGEELSEDLKIHRSEGRKPYLFTEALFFCAKNNSRRHEAVARKDNNTIAHLDTTSEELAKVANLAFSNLHECLKKHSSAVANVRYGDLVQIFNLKTLNNLIGQSRPNPSFTHAGSENDGSVVCQTNYDNRIDHLGINPIDFWWVIKGPHSDTDFFNAVENSYVKVGDKIRLESLTAKKNLHATKFKVPKTKDLYSGSCQIVTLYGNEGIGDIQDEWTIEVEGKSNGESIYPGEKFSLKNERLNLYLGSDFSCRGFMPGLKKDLINSIEYAMGMQTQESGEENKNKILWTIGDFKRNWWSSKGKEVPIKAPIENESLLSGLSYNLPDGYKITVKDSDEDWTLQDNQYISGSGALIEWLASHTVNINPNATTTFKSVENKKHLILKGVANDRGKFLIGSNANLVFESCILELSGPYDHTAGTITFKGDCKIKGNHNFTVKSGAILSVDGGTLEFEYFDKYIKENGAAESLINGGEVIQKRTGTDLNGINPLAANIFTLSPNMIFTVNDLDNHWPLSRSSCQIQGANASIVWPRPHKITVYENKTLTFKGDSNNKLKLINIGEGYLTFDVKDGGKVIFENCQLNLAGNLTYKAGTLIFHNNSNIINKNEFSLTEINEQLNPEFSNPKL